MGCCLPMQLLSLQQSQPNGGPDSFGSQDKKIIQNSDVKFQHGFHEHYSYKDDLLDICFEDKKYWRIAHKVGNEKEIHYVNVIQGQLKPVHIQKIASCTKLRHPNLVRLVDVYDDYGQTLLIYENFPCGRLIEQFSNLKSLKESLICQISLQIFSGLAKLHQHGIVHEDINGDTFVCKNPSIIQLIGYANERQRIHPKSNQLCSTYTHYLAPEQIYQNCCPSAETNVWACGVFIHFLLTGQFLFQGKTEAIVQNQISRGFINLNNNELSRYSPGCRKFLKKLFSFRPQDRPQAKNLIKDEWLMKFAQFDTPIPKTVINQFALIKKYKKVQEASITYLIQQEYYNQVEEKLYFQFQKLDRDNSGLVSRDEFFAGLIETMGEDNSRKIVDSIFKNLKGNTEISFEDFSKILIARDRELTDKQLVKTYNILDKNKQGLISIKDMIIFLSKHRLDERIVKKILKEADQNHDGWISFDEFKQLMRQVRVLKRSGSVINLEAKLGRSKKYDDLVSDPQTMSPPQPSSPISPEEVDQALMNFSNRPDATSTQR